MLNFIVVLQLIGRRGRKRSNQEKRGGKKEGTSKSSRTLNPTVLTNQCPKYSFSRQEEKGERR